MRRISALTVQSEQETVNQGGTAGIPVPMGSGIPVFLIHDSRKLAGVFSIVHDNRKFQEGEQKWQKKRNW